MSQHYARYHASNMGPLVIFILVISIPTCLLMFLDVAYEENLAEKQEAAQLATAPTVDPNPLPYEEGLLDGQEVYIDAVAFELISGFSDDIVRHVYEKYYALVITENGETFNVYIDAEFYQKNIDETAPSSELDRDGSLTKMLDTPLRVYGNVRHDGSMFCERLSPSDPSENK